MITIIYPCWDYEGIMLIIGTLVFFFGMLISIFEPLFNNTEIEPVGIMVTTGCTIMFMFQTLGYYNIVLINFVSAGI